MSPVDAVEEIRKIAAQGRSFLVATHRNPDGDAVGSCLAVRLILRGLGKEALAWLPEGVPQSYRFLEGAGEAVRTLPAGEKFDATFVVDTADEGILGAPLPPRETTGPVVVIDHHRTRTEWGEVYLYRDASAVGEIVFDLARDLGATVTTALAECVFTAMMTDTGSFRYETTTARVMHVAAECIELGVSPWKVALEVYETFPRSRVELLVEVLSTLRVDIEGTFASLLARPEALARHGLGPDALEDFVNYARAIEGVEVAALLRRRQDGAIRVSLRSRGKIDVSLVAKNFGGGGHRGAAGCTIEGLGLEEAREAVRLHLEKDWKLASLRGEEPRRG